MSLEKMTIFIPIKKESQRVPNKNFRDFFGKSLWRHTVDKYVDHDVYIDTDSDEIIEACKDLDNVTAYRRSKGLEGNLTSVLRLIDDFIDRYQIAGTICQLHVTHPFLSAETVYSSYKEFWKSDHDSAFSANILQTRLWRFDKNLVPINHNPIRLIQTQDLSPVYEENSCFYMFDVDSYMRCHSRVGGDPYPMETEWPENLDIDTEDDWDLCQAVQSTQKV